MERKKALVVGGTGGIGLDVVRNLISQNYEVITISRSSKGLRGLKHFSCDVGDLERLDKKLDDLSSEGAIDVVFCMTGYSAPKQFNDLGVEDFQETYTRNFFYILKIFQKLKSHLEMAPDPLFVTIGSRWSYRHDCGEILPYICAKHSLRFFMSHITKNNPLIKFRHYIVPVTQTPSYEEVRKNLESVLPGTKVLFPYEPAKSTEVAQTLVDHLLTTEGLNSIYVVGKDYSVKSESQVSFN